MNSKKKSTRHLLMTSIIVIITIESVSCVHQHYYSNQNIWRQYQRQPESSHKKFLRSIKPRQELGNENLFQQWLPFDQSIYLMVPGNAKRVYFQVLKGHGNNSLSISPCGLMNMVSIKVQLYLIRLKTIKKFHNKRKIGDQFQNDLARIINRRLTKHHRKLLVLEQLIGERTTFESKLINEPGIYIIQMTPGDSAEITLELYLSSMGIASYPPTPPVATIMVQQMYNQSPKHFQKLFFHTEVLESNFKNESTVKIWWNPASELAHEQYEYCLLVQKNYPYQSNCLNHLFKNDTWNPIELNDVASKFKWWLSSELNPIYRKEVELNKFAYFKCSSKTEAVINGLGYEQLYFADVFLKSSNKSNGLVSKYWTTNFTLREFNPMEKNIWKEQLESMQILHDSLFTGIFLDSNNQYRKSFLYKLPKDQALLSKKVYIYIQPCFGVGPIQLTVRQLSVPNFNQARNRRDKYNALFNFERTNEINDERDRDSFYGHDNGKDESEMLFFGEITETRTIEIQIPFWLKNETNTYLELELNTLSLRQSRSLVLLASNALDKFPFPRLPNDKTIRAMETLKKCNSVTLVWNFSPDERVTYCILQRDAKYANGFQESKHLCFKIKPNKRSLNKDRKNAEVDSIDIINERYLNEQSQPTRKVLCRRYKARKRSNNLIMQQIRKLQPGRQYIFLVTIKGRQNTLNYEQIWTETKGDCYNEPKNINGA